jgi:hypothetical protein
VELIDKATKVKIDSTELERWISKQRGVEEPLQLREVTHMRLMRMFLLSAFLIPSLAGAQPAGQPGQPGEPDDAAPPPAVEPTEPTDAPPPVSQPTSPGAPPPAAPTAAPPPVDQPPEAPPHMPARYTGLMGRLGFGVDGCTDDFCDNVDPMVFVRVQGLYRFMRYVAAGLHASFMFNDPDEPAGTDVDVFGVFVVGAEGRAIFPFRALDAWTGFTLGYARYQVNGGAQGVDVTGYANGFALGWGFGADYYLTETIGLGLGFYLYKPFWDEVCQESNEPMLDTGCQDLSDEAKDQIGIWWTLGVNLTFHLPM